MVYYCVHITIIVLLKKKIKQRLRLQKKEHGLDAIFAKENKLPLQGFLKFNHAKLSALDKRIIIEANYTHPDFIAETSANLKLGGDRHLYCSSRGSEPDLAFGLNYFFKILLNFSNVSSYADAQHVSKEPKERLITLHHSELDTYDW